ncbi:MAG: hypothetical protein D6689_09320 [Deltaproteobacteria bacterium]|nr:MAG: hypothetical protein D6689_09320 [Deltaproteobacteria bacterium]
MASRSETRTARDGDIDIAEELDSLEQAIDRCKVLYEQYFMGVQKAAPATLHRQIERRMLVLTQRKERNTALRFRINTLTQKYGSYNTYWKRTLRAIEQGRYAPHLAAAARRQVAKGRDVPDEILAQMPKLLRDRVLRDRERLRARAERDADSEAAAVVRQPKPRVHEIEEADLGDDFDFDAMFDAILADDARGKASATDEHAAKRTAPAARPAKTSPEPGEPAPARPRPGDGAAQRRSTPPPLPADVRAAGEPVRTGAAARAGAYSRRQRAGSAPHPASPRAATAGGAARTPPRPAPASAAPSATKPTLPPGMTEAKARALYAQYVKAKKLVGERTDNVTFDKLVRTLNRQAPRILQQHNAKAVDFNVVVKDNRVVLKARPKKK